VRDPGRRACIYVLAGTNGAGKSSIAGAMFVAKGAEYFNPDEAANRIRSAHPALTQAEANSAAWHQGKRLLGRAIAEQLNFAFETTLGGKTIPALLGSALSAGLEVRVWYVGLNSVELHIARVRARVEKGGHAIPEQKIRDRYDRSRLNLIRLMPRLTELAVYDNSEEADPDAGKHPEPRLLLHMAAGKMVFSCELPEIPEWAKPILAAALKVAVGRM
jgi:predicted ABC-type ATPase